MNQETKPAVACPVDRRVGQRDADGLIVLEQAQEPKTSDERALRLCALLALTAKGVAEGWEPLLQWDQYQMLDAFSRVHERVDVDAWRLVLIEVRKAHVFDRTFSYHSGMLHFNPSVSRDMAVLMLAYCQNAGVFPRYTLSEAYEAQPNAG